jgi:folate-binding protein YgfZ
MNPLLDLHRLSPDVETRPYDQIEIVDTFGVPQAEYAAIRKSAGLMDVPQRGIVEVTGKDRHAFLNNLLTNQIYDKASKAGLKPGSVTYAFLLNLKGRVVLDVNLVELGDRTLIELDARLAEMFAKLLDRYLFAEQVKVTNRVGTLHQMALHGPRVDEVLRAEGIPTGRLTSAEAVKIIGAEVVVCCLDECGVPGVRLIVSSDKARAVWEHLTTRHGAEIELGKRLLRPVGWAAYNATRIEAGTPLFGIDFELAEPSVPGAKPQAAGDAPETTRASGVLPAETGLLERAVSFTKGCYLGQEVVARMHARSQVARKLVGLRVADGALPIAGEHVFDARQNQVGAITSSTMSPMLSDAAVALALVKKPNFEVGASLQVPAEGKMRAATVVALPFVGS